MVSSHIRSPQQGSTSSPGTVVVEETPRWIRGYFGDTKIVDSKTAYLVWEGTNSIPYWAFPTQDVIGLVENNHTDAGEEGYRAQWYDLKASSKTISDIGWKIKPDVPGYIQEANNLVVIDTTKVDKWYEDDEQVKGHAAGPYNRIDIRKSSRPVKVVIDGVTVAETNSALFLYENGYVTRYYIDTADIKNKELFHPTSHTSVCPYKGVASYYSATINGKEYENIVWFYPEPIDAVAKLKGHWSFYNEKLDIYVDGEKLLYN